MKLRNKLIAVLAASMIVTSVPVITMAESSNTISIYNYKIKNTTVGFKTTDDGYTGGGIQAPVRPFTGNGVTGKFSTREVLPKLEITPHYNYKLGAQQTAFVSLTKDSNFVTVAYLAFVDALNNGGTSALYVDEKGEVKGSVTPEWNGKTPLTLVNNGEIKLSFDVNSGRPTKYTEGKPSVTIKPFDAAETTYNERKYKSTIRMDFTGNFDKDTSYGVPFLVKVGGDSEVLARLDGTDSFVSSRTYTLTGVLSDQRTTVSSKSETITCDNIEKIGEIRIDENQIGSLTDGNRWVKVKLPSSADLEFNLTKTRANIKATGKNGFYGTTKTDLNVKYGRDPRDSRDYDEDNQVLLIELPDWSDPSAKGQIVLTGIYVQPQDKTAATGDVNVTVSEDLTWGGDADNHASSDLMDSTSVKVATIADYDVTLTSTPVDVKAGRSGVIKDKTVTFLLKEGVKDSLVDTRKIEFTVENGYIFGPADVEDDGDHDYHYSTASYSDKAKERFIELIEDGTIEFKEKGEEKKSENKQGFVKDSLSLDIDENGYIVGFSGIYDRLLNTSADKIEVTMPIAAPVQATGEIKVKASNLFTRTYDEDVECVVANIIEPIEVEVEQAAIKVGLEQQQAGSITIKETDKGMLERGWLFLSAEDLQDGIEFDELPEIKVSGTDSDALKIEHAQISRDKKVIAFEITRTSKEATSIEISNIKFTSDRTVPEASYDLQIWGNALTDENVLDVISYYSTNVLNTKEYRDQYTDMYVVPDFITMTTKNTEDITSSGLKAATAEFVIGKNSFTVNGEAVAMDAAAYIKDNFTFVPVRYVAQAFGIEGNAVQYDKATSTATIVAGDKVIALTAGKPYIICNGTMIPMATKAEVVDGRMCVPMAYIAAALDVEKSWDSATKTAIFSNQEDAE